MAQRPCRDTLVHCYDTICEGMSYDFNGRTLTRGGMYFDTLPRFSGPCDSVVFLHLAMLYYPVANPVATNCCDRNPGYWLYSSEGKYFSWSSQPDDTSLLRQLHADSVFVNPAVPTVYYLTSDWRSTPQCPSHGSLRLSPLAKVHASFKAFIKDFDYSNMQVEIEDRSTGNRETPYGGWAGRHWYFNGELLPQTGANITIQVQPWMGDSLKVKLEAYSPTCSDTASRVILFPKGLLSFPNAFTPSASSNNVFMPATDGVTDYEISIFDRQGIRVFYSNQLSVGWDGTSQGRPCRAGTYVYRCRYRCDTTPYGDQFRTGTVTLIR